MNGRLTGTNKDTDRETLQGYYDNHTIRRYKDGIRDIDVIVVSFVVNYRAPQGDWYDYTMTLVEYNQ